MALPLDRAGVGRDSGGHERRRISGGNGTSPLSLLVISVNDAAGGNSTCSLHAFTVFNIYTCRCHLNFKDLCGLMQDRAGGVPALSGDRATRTSLGKSGGLRGEDDRRGWRPEL